MAKENFKNRPESELRSMLKEKHDTLRSLRFRVAKGKVKNVKESRGLKREVARILTQINSKKS